MTSMLAPFCVFMYAVLLAGRTKELLLAMRVSGSPNPLVVSFPTLLSLRTPSVTKCCAGGSRLLGVCAGFSKSKFPRSPNFRLVCRSSKFTGGKNGKVSVSGSLT